MNCEVSCHARLALRLAVRLETGRIGLRCIAADHRGSAPLEAANSAFNWVRELASQLPPLRAEWEHVAVAVGQFHRARLAGQAGEFHRCLFAVEQRAEVLAQCAIRWALFEPRQANLPMDVANAFIAWDSARKVLHEQRQAVSRQHFAGSDCAAASTAAELHDICQQCEIHSAALLLKASGALDRHEDADGQ